MHTSKGFTVIEIMVTLVVLTILLTIGIVSYRGAQATARDRERASDVEAIAAHLEGIYTQEIMSGSTRVKAAGTYPARSVFDNETYFKLVFDGLQGSAMSAPGVDGRALKRNTNPAGATGLVPVTVTPTLTINDYIYVPTVANGQTCAVMNNECRAFKIFYRTEKEGYKVVESKRK